MNINNNMVAVIDFGSQYTQLIARRIRELNVFSEVLPHNTSVSVIQKKQNVNTSYFKPYNIT